MEAKKITGVDIYERGLFMLDDNIECDWCDEIKTCASINWFGNNVICVCKQCLETFAKAFEDDEEKSLF